MQKGNILVFLLIGIALLAVAYGTYYFGYDYGFEKSVKNTQPSASATTVPSDETANWKSYTLLNSPLTFKYPEYLTLAEDYFTFDGVHLVSPKGCKVSTECHIIMTIQALKNTKSYSLDEYYMIAGDADVFKDIPHQETTIADQKAYKYQTPNDQDVVAIFGNNDWIFIIKDDDNLLGEMNVLEKILSTFKVIQ